MIELLQNLDAHGQFRKTKPSGIDFLEARIHRFKSCAHSQVAVALDGALLTSGALRIH